MAKVPQRKFVLAAVFLQAAVGEGPERVQQPVPKRFVRPIDDDHGLVDE